MSRSATYSLSFPCNLVRSARLGTGGITSFSDPIVVFPIGTSGTFGAVVDLASGRADAFTVLTGQVRFTAYAIGVFFVWVGTFRFTSSSIG